MPRQPRKKSPGLVHHIVHRGINRQNIFCDPNDRFAFLRILEKAAEKHGADLLAYCLMTNHFHLMVEDHDDKISEIMHYVNGIYTTAFNLKHQCEGALLRGRFYSSPVNSNHYELVLFRYIHLNPVVANIVPSPGHYAWSSFKAYLGQKTTVAVATDRLSIKLSTIGVEQHRLARWMQEQCPSLDATCSPEGLSAWVTESKMLDGRGRQFHSSWASPLLKSGVTEVLDALPPGERARAAGLMAICEKVAVRHNLHLRDLAAPNVARRASKARAEAMLMCREIHNASDDALAQLFCLSAKSIASLLCRARKLRGSWCRG